MAMESYTLSSSSHHRPAGSAVEAGALSSPLAGAADSAATSLFEDAFSADIQRRYQAAKEAKADIEQKMLEDMRRRDGEYDPHTLARIRQIGGSEAFDNITDLKCSAAEALFSDAFFFSGQDYWALEPTPIPDLDEAVEQRALRLLVSRVMADGLDPATMPAEEFEAATAEIAEQAKKVILDEAERRADGMEKLIRDQLAEGGFEEALADFIVDVCTHRVGALMGPIPQLRKVMRAVGGEIIWEEKLILATERVNPLDLYPASMSTKPGDGDFFVRRRIGLDEAIALQNLPDINLSQLSKALAKRGAASEPTDEQQAIIAQGVEDKKAGDSEHELVFWWRRMSRAQVSIFTGDEEPEEALKSEQVAMQGIMLNGIVIKAHENIDKSGSPNVFVASFRKRPGTMWGFGISALCKGQQDQINVIARALANNIHKSSAPSYQADHAALMDPAALTKTFPGQVIYTRQMPGDNRHPVVPLETSNHTPVLLAARDKGSQWMDEKTGIYPQAYGSPAQVGPAETLGGYQLLRQDQTKAFKRALLNVSQCIAQLIKAYWRWNMLFSEDESIKGDVEVVTRGAVELYISSDESGQLLAALQMLTQNPLLLQAAKDGGAAWLFREILRMRRLDPDKILKSEDEILAEAEAARRQAEEQAQMPPAGGEQELLPPQPRPDSEAAIIRANADMIRAQAQAKRVDLEAENLSISRAEALANIREKILKTQREIAGERMARAIRPTPMPAQPRMLPAPREDVQAMAPEEVELVQ